MHMDLIHWYIYVQIGLVAFLLIGGAILLFLAVMRRDYEIILRRPILFGIELLLIAVLPALPILFFVVSRGMDWDTAVTWFYGLSIKFALFHVLFQISGLYSFMLTAA